MLTQLTKNVKKGQVRVKIKTTHGDMTFKLFEKDIPKAVENFLTHAKKVLHPKNWTKYSVIFV